MLENLSRNELQNLMESYNDYIMHFREEHDISCEPISIYEYYNNEYQMIADEDDENNYCVNCGCEKEDYESMYCDECFEEEQERLYGEQEEIHYESIGVGVEDTENGIRISVMGDTDTLEQYDLELNIGNTSRKDLYFASKNVSQKLTQYYYENKATLPTLSEVKNMFISELLK